MSFYVSKQKLIRSVCDGPQTSICVWCTAQGLHPHGNQVGKRRQPPLGIARSGGWRPPKREISPLTAWGLKCVRRQPYLPGRSSFLNSRRIPSTCTATSPSSALTISHTTSRLIPK